MNFRANLWDMKLALARLAKELDETAGVTVLATDDEVLLITGPDKDGKLTAIAVPRIENGSPR